MKLPKVPTSAIISARFSPRRSSEYCESNDMQIQACRIYCDRKNYDVKAIFQDEAMSGDDEKRPGLWDALHSLKRGMVLVVHKWDRLARSVRLTEYFRWQVEKKGARIESASEAFNEDTSENKLMRNMIAGFAEYEKDKIAARTRFAMRQKQANGQRMGRIDKTPYGWVRNPSDASLLIEDPGEQKVIKTVCREYEGGKGYLRISMNLMDLGIQCRGAERWWASTVKNILRRAGKLGEGV